MAISQLRKELAQYTANQVAFNLDMVGSDATRVRGSNSKEVLVYIDESGQGLGVQSNVRQYGYVGLFKGTSDILEGDIIVRGSSKYFVFLVRDIELSNKIIYKEARIFKANQLAINIDRLSSGTPDFFGGIGTVTFSNIKTGITGILEHSDYRINAGDLFIKTTEELNLYLSALEDVQLKDRIIINSENYQPIIIDKNRVPGIQVIEMGQDKR